MKYYHEMELTRNHLQGVDTKNNGDYLIDECRMVAMTGRVHFGELVLLGACIHACLHYYSYYYSKN